MSLLFKDSFDHYVTADIPEKWTAFFIGISGATVVINPATGRHSSASLRINHVSARAPYATKALLPVPASPVAIMGLGFKTSGAGAFAGIASIRDGSTVQVSLQLNADLTLSVLRGSIVGGTVLGTTTTALVLGVYAFIEWKVTINNTTGTVAVRINGVNAMTPLTGQNTRVTAANQWNGFSLGMDSSTSASSLSGAALDHDDLYVCDGAGSAPQNDFLGDVRCDARYSTAAGANTGFTPSAGANFQCVDEVAPNDDTDFNSATTVGLTDTFAFQDAPVVGAAIFGIQHNINVKKMDAGAASIAPITRHSGVDNVGTDVAPGTDYAYVRQIQQVNPGTGVQWLEADFNAAEFGYRKTV